MLFPKKVFKSFCKNKITDTKQSTEALFYFSAETRGEADEMAKSVKQAGGTIFSESGEKDGWMYGCGFAEPDGHRRNMHYIDRGEMPKKICNQEVIFLK